MKRVLLLLIFMVVSICSFADYTPNNLLIYCPICGHSYYHLIMDRHKIPATCLGECEVCGSMWTFLLNDCYNYILLRGPINPYNYENQAN